MTDLWGMLYQSLIVCLSACFLLLIKRIFKDKLSGVWQYSVWAILLVRAQIPASVTGWLFFQQAAYLFECLKVNVEKGLNSSYTSAFQLSVNRAVLPLIKGMPSSITDWLFVIYTAGVLVFLLRLIITAIRLSLLISKAADPSEAQKELIEKTAEKYGLKTGRIKVLPEIPSPFVYGIFHQTLVLPEETVLDEKIIFHEGFHLKYHDALQNMIWHIILCLHWWNPFMHYIISLIRNDLETLCDQRVLERLTQTERKEYGQLLLVYGNEKYTNIPGTSSIANGAENITWRIEAVARFAKYPENMRLVSVCMLAIMAWPVMIGSFAVYGYDEFAFVPQDQIEETMVKTRLCRAETPAAALDIYGKGLLSRNGYYLAMVSELSEQEEIMNSIGMNENGHSHSLIDPGESMSEEYRQFSIFNFVKAEQGGYDADLLFYPVVTEYVPEETERDYTLIPVHVSYDHGWIVNERGERRQSVTTRPYSLCASDDPWAKGEKKTDEGVIEIHCARTSSVSWTEDTDLQSLNTRENFDHSWQYYTLQFQPADTSAAYGFQFSPVSDDKETMKFPDRPVSSVCSGTDGKWNYAAIAADSKTPVILQFAEWVKGEPEGLPAPCGFAVQLYKNQELVYEGYLYVSQ